MDLQQLARVLVFIAVASVAIADLPYYCHAPLPIPSVHTTGLSLKQVQVVTRHGDRTTLNVIPGDNNVWDCTLNWLALPGDSLTTVIDVPDRIYRKLYLDEFEMLPGNCSFGQLTEKGLKQHILLGQTLRDLYVTKYGLLSPNYEEGELWVRSTDVPRTVQSAMGLLFGLYPPEQIPGGIEVIPINTRDQWYEEMVANPNVCPNYPKAEDAVHNTTAWKQEAEAAAPLVQKLSAILNIPVQQMPSLDQLTDTFRAEQCHGMTLWPGITPDLVNEIQGYVDKFQTLLFDDDLAGELGFAPFLQELLSHMQDFISGQDDTKFRLFSGHDTTVGPLMGTLGVFDDTWPPYASNAQFELWENESTKQWYVQLKYNGQITQPPVSDTQFRVGSPEHRNQMRLDAWKRAWEKKMIKLEPLRKSLSQE